MHSAHFQAIFHFWYWCLLLWYWRSNVKYCQLCKRPSCKENFVNELKNYLFRLMIREFAISYNTSTTLPNRDLVTRHEINLQDLKLHQLGGQAAWCHTCEEGPSFSSHFYKVCRWYTLGLKSQFISVLLAFATSKVVALLMLMNLSIHQKCHGIWTILQLLKRRKCKS